MSRSSRSLFQTIRSEGGLLPADLLQRVAQGERDLGVRAEDYHLTDLPLNEAIVRSWNRLVGAWVQFRDARRDLPDDDPGTTLTRERWLLVLFEELRFGRLQTARAVEIDGKSYPVSHVWDHVPIHLVGCNVPLDRRSARVAGAATHSPHGLLQELLNRSEERLWGFVSNGLLLRLLRDNSSFTRQAYLEFDLEQMMDSEAYSDFVLLWLTCHQSRVEGENPYKCRLEEWSQEAAKQGTRALDSLRDGVETAIRELGGGFLTPGRNGELREALRSGALSTQDYYRQLLRLVYRLLFLFVAEDRGLLHDPRASDEAKERYGRWYSTRRLRDLAGRRRGTKHGDLWEGLKLVMAGLGNDDGCTPLGLPALGSFLWSEGALPHLERAQLPNRVLLEAVRALATVRDGKVLRAVDYKNLGAEELGSVYESLLELHPELDAAAGTFALRVAAGNERKTTGSYYTPTSLISVLLDSALDPVLEEAAAKDEEAILNLKVVDPACGSGHFLVAAAHRIAKRLAAVRSGDDEPSPKATRQALRDVVSRCIYGVDANPMAVELCRVSLWMEALDPGRPLSFLDAHIRRGNSLLGATPQLIAAGIPDEAFKAIEGDDAKVASELRKRNRQERRGQLSMEDEMGDLEAALAADAAQLEAAPDDSLAAVRSKAKLFEKLEESEEHQSAKLLADAWCAAFVQLKTKDAPVQITDGVLRRLAGDLSRTPEGIQREIRHLAHEYGFFHWHIEFPQVFGVSPAESNASVTATSRGFDVLLGNPPWDRPKPEAAKYFAATHRAIADAPNAAARARRLADLETDDSSAHAAWKRYERRVLGSVAFLVNSGLFKLTATGKFNLGNTFLELALRLLSAPGRAGLLNISGIATDDSGKHFISRVMETQTLVALFDFENREGLFPGVHRSYRFSAITLAGSSTGAPADFVFFAHTTSDLDQSERHVRFTADDIALLNPISRNCPIFRDGRQAELVKALYRKAALRDPDASVLFRWDAEPTFLFVMSDHSHLFVTSDAFDRPIEPRIDDILRTVNGTRYVPLYESKMFNQFDHRWSSLTSRGDQVETSDEQRADPQRVAVPRYWMKVADAEVKLGHLPKEWLIAVREVTHATNERTAIATILPKYPVGHNAQVFAFREPASSAASLLANLNCFCLDFAARSKVGGSHLSSFILRQLPILPRSLFVQLCPWAASQQLEEWIQRRVLELTFTAWDLARFARDCGYPGPPFAWTAARRLAIRSELDAAFFHLYGLARDDVDYVMDTFPIVRDRDVKAHGEYRTKRVILEIFDELAQAIETGEPYQTRLDPPPADPRVAHPPRSEAEAASAAAAR
jgi:N-6 DNA Methylase